MDLVGHCGAAVLVIHLRLPRPRFSANAGPDTGLKRSTGNNGMSCRQDIERADVIGVRFVCAPDAGKQRLGLSVPG